ncbi:MAG TPA: AI-2E family transporter [Ktedonobacterales bacterium]|nr:AI-2E family transporter [Ktedonobacterales bacterium]
MADGDAAFVTTDRQPDRARGADEAEANGDAAGRSFALDSQVRPRTVVVVLLTALGLLAGLYVLWQLQDILRWGLVAAFLAVALNPAVNWLHRHHIRRSVAILLVYGALLLALAGLGALVLPPLIAQVRGLIVTLVSLFQRPGGPEQALRALAERYGLGGLVSGLQAQLSALPNTLSGAAGPLLAVASGVLGSITALLSILLITFFLLLDGAHFVARGIGLVPHEQQRARLRRITAASARAVSGYVTGNLAISLIAGIFTFAALTVLRVPYALALALVVALLDLIPLVGATLGAIICIVIAFFVGPLTAVLVIVFFVVYQQLENNILQPLVYGRSVHLHPLAIFVAVLAGGQLLGILGALLAIPVAEIIRILLVEWYGSRPRAAAQTLATPPDVPPPDDLAERGISPPGVEPDDLVPPRPGLTAEP